MDRPTTTDATAATLRVWQPRTPRTLSAEDAREITRNTVGFLAILREWATADERESKS